MMMKLLAINPEQLNQQGLIEYLVVAGFEPIAAYDIDQGLDLAADCAPDIIIYDMPAPEPAAFDFIHLLRDDPATTAIPFILLTGYADQYHVRRAMALGADDVLLRPFSAEDLLSSIEARLRRHAPYQHLQAGLDTVVEAEQLKTDMIRIAAHDLRNPLNTIAAALKLLRRKHGIEYLEENFSELEDIESAAVQMNRITSDILSIEHIEALLQNRAYDTVDLKALVQECFQTHQSWVQQKNQQAELGLTLPPILVDGDPGQLREAINNLIANAIKYTPDGGSLRVRLDKIGRKTRFTVEDSGYGIPEDQQAKLFKAFQRAKTAETAHIEGSGLGLHLVKKIIDRHEGEVLVQSVYGEGSVFGFFLPLKTLDDTLAPVKHHRSLVTRLVNKLTSL